jgi:3-oxoacyl-[acyl-carrier protein] reductase
MRLDGKVALVTGGGSGIGRAIVRRFSTEGARVIVNDIDGEAARATLAGLGAAAAARGLAVQADVASSAAVRAMFAEVDAKYGGLDILVNNAGIAEFSKEETPRVNACAERRIGEQMSGSALTPFSFTEDMTDEAWRRLLAVHLDGTFYCSRSALGLMGKLSPGGAIVNMSSVAGLMGLAPAPHYSAAKAGILGLTFAMAQEVGSRKIRVNAICPGFIDTPMTAGISPMLKMMMLGQTPLGRWGEPDEIAETALFLASDGAAYITGQALSPNGGLRIGV